MLQGDIRKSQPIDELTKIKENYTVQSFPAARFESIIKLFSFGIFHYLKENNKDYNPTEKKNQMSVIFISVKNVLS